MRSTPEKKCVENIPSILCLKPNLEKAAFLSTPKLVLLLTEKMYPLQSKTDSLRGRILAKS
jgi:hypothetical protein